MARDFEACHILGNIQPICRYVYQQTWKSHFYLFVATNFMTINSTKLGRNLFAITREQKVMLKRDYRPL